MYKNITDSILESNLAAIAKKKTTPKNINKYTIALFFI
jgi:hypothetical protein